MVTTINNSHTIPEFNYADSIVDPIKDAMDSRTSYNCVTLNLYSVTTGMLMLKADVFAFSNFTKPQ